MKYDELKKVHSRVSYNRYLYYEPKTAHIEREEKKGGDGLFFGITWRFFLCGLIFGILFIFSQLPMFQNLTASVKTAIVYNKGIFEVEKPGTIPLKESIMAVLYPDKTPLDYTVPLITEDIQYNDNSAVLTQNQNPLIYSVESGIINKITRNNGIITIEIKHRNDTVSRYEGIRFAGVEVGQTVKKNFPIGVLGQQQLVFKLFINGIEVNVSEEVQWG